MAMSDNLVRNKMLEVERQRYEVERCRLDVETKKLKVLSDIRDVMLMMNGMSTGHVAFSLAHLAEWIGAQLQCPQLLPLTRVVDVHLVLRLLLTLRSPHGYFQLMLNCDHNAF